MLNRFLITSLALALAAIIFSCSQNDTSDIDSVETWDLSGVKSGTLVLPTGTVGYANFETNRLTYDYPEGVFYLSNGPIRGFNLLEGGCLDCISRCNGCNPKNNGEDLFCTRCDTEAFCTSHNCGQEEIGNGSGFIDMKAGVGLVESGELSSRIEADFAASFAVMMMHPEAKKVFDNFVNELWGHNPTQKELEGSQRLVANVFGKPLIVKVPADYAAEGLMRGEETTCECKDEGERTGCELKEEGGGGYPLIEECSSGTCVWCRMKT